MADKLNRLRNVNLETNSSTSYLAKLLRGPELLALTEQYTAELHAIYESMLPVRTTRLTRQPAPGNLKRSAFYYVTRGGFGEDKDRWMGYVGNSAPYAAAVEYGNKHQSGQHTLALAAEAMGFNAGGFKASSRSAITRKENRLIKEGKLKAPKPSRVDPAEAREHRRKVSIEEQRARRNEKRAAQRIQGAKNLRDNIELQRAKGAANKELKAQRKRERELERDRPNREKREAIKGKGVDKNSGVKNLTTEEKIDRFFKLAQSKDEKKQKEAARLRVEIQKEQALQEVRGQQGDDESRYEELIARKEKGEKLSAIESKFIRQFEDS